MHANVMFYHFQGILSLDSSPFKRIIQKSGNNHHLKTKPLRIYCRYSDVKLCSVRVLVREELPRKTFAEKSNHIIDEKRKSVEVIQ
jgi:hypothetical protein